MNSDSDRWEELILSPADLEEIRTAMADRIREGLGQKDGEIQAIPTYLPPPQLTSTGKTIVIDIGGTNMRAAVVALGAGGEVEIVRGPMTAPFLPVWESADAFFKKQAELALSLDPPPELPVGYCFSYPTAVTPQKDAVLIRWTKQLQVPDVVGRKVGELLLNACRNLGYRGLGVTVLNDTVAALLGGNRAFGADDRFHDFIGLIVGTGTNMAAYFPTKLLASKLADTSYSYQRMAVNLESGNFHPPCLSRFDDEFDAAGPTPGSHRVEKAISGKFIPQLFSFIEEGRTSPPYPETKEIFQLAQQAPDSPKGALTLALINRSADLVAAGLAGLIDTLGSSGNIGILAEGGVINHNPDYKKRVREKLALLLDDDPLSPHRFTLLQLENVNLIGAAAAAL